jgi:hypothetical protein
VRRGPVPVTPPTATPVHPTATPYVASASTSNVNVCTLADYSAATVTCTRDDSALFDLTTGPRSAASAPSLVRRAEADTDVAHHQQRQERQPDRQHCAGQGREGHAGHGPRHGGSGPAARSVRGGRRPGPSAGLHVPGNHWGPR